MVEQPREKISVRVPPANQILAAIEKENDSRTKISLIRGALVIHLGWPEDLADKFLRETQFSNAELARLLESQLPQGLMGSTRSLMRSAFASKTPLIPDPEDRQEAIVVRSDKGEVGDVQLPVDFQPFGKSIQAYVNNNLHWGNVETSFVGFFPHYEFKRTLIPSIDQMEAMSFVQPRRKRDLIAIVNGILIAHDRKVIPDVLKEMKSQKSLASGEKIRNHSITYSTY